MKLQTRNTSTPVIRVIHVIAPISQIREVYADSLWFRLNLIRFESAFASAGLKWERWEVTGVKVLHKASNTWKTFWKHLESIWKQLDWIEMQFYRFVNILWRFFTEGQNISFTVSICEWQTQLSTFSSTVFSSLWTTYPPFSC